MPPDEASSWLEKSRADLAAARFLRSNPGLATEIAAFHYQQAAEKAIKGVIILDGTAPSRVHDLRALLAELSPGDDLDADAADALTPFAVLSRYPGFGAQPDDVLLARFDAFAESCVERLAGRLGD
jgi:HEPN domain-containing protein